MLHLLVSCLALSLGQGAGKGAGRLEITNPRSTYGHLGAVRPKDAGIIPGDVVHVSFDILNLKLDANGRAAYSVEIEVRDAKGELAYHQRPYNAVAQNFFGGNSMPCSAHVEVPLDAQPGARHWKVTIHDRTADTKATLEGKGEVLKPGFALVRIGTFADGDSRVPVPPIGVAGGNLYVNCAAVGFARDPKTQQPDVWVEMRVLDDKGQPTFTKPINGHIKQDVPPSLRIVPMHFGLTLNRPGRFTVELTARCQLCGASSTTSFPLRILPME